MLFSNLKYFDFAHIVHELWGNKCNYIIDWSSKWNVRGIFSLCWVNAAFEDEFEYVLYIVGYIIVAGYLIQNYKPGRIHQVSASMCRFKCLVTCELHCGVLLVLFSSKTLINILSTKIWVVIEGLGFPHGVLGSQPHQVTHSISKPAPPPPSPEEKKWCIRFFFSEKNTFNGCWWCGCVSFLSLKSWCGVGLSS